MIIMQNITVRIIVLLAFIAMVTANVLANALPINNITTGQVSDSYPDLFAPAGITFSIWGVIYLLLFGYALYQLGVIGRISKNKKTMDIIAVFFVVSSIANILWILSWHYDIILASLFFMLVILYSLIRIALLLSTGKNDGMEYYFLELPFMVYFGWITIATIANVTAYLVSIGWDGFGISEQVWTVIVLIVGATIGLTTMFRIRSIAYGMVLIWAYTGIVLKHASEAGFGGEYPLIIITASLSIIIFIIAVFVQYNRSIPNNPV
ncbi:MAG: tryptophan-rich sensory protein [Candidatus Woesearchaeota archaeon]